MEYILYYALTIVLTVFVMDKYSQENWNFERLGYPYWFTALLVTFILTFVIGLMPFTGHYDADRANYAYWVFLYQGKQFAFSWTENNFIFDNLYAYVACNNLPPETLFLPVSAIYFGCMLWACRKFFPKDILLAFLVYLGAFSTYSYGVNGAKAGAAASLFLLAMAFRNNKTIAALFCFLSLGFHHSMFVPIAVFVITYFVRNRNYYLYAWFISCVLAAMGNTFIQDFLASMTEDNSYIARTNEVKVVSGFRIDFILYSAVPIYLGYYLHKHFDIESPTYDFLLNLYTGTNALFVLCTFGTYVNRIAYLSWLMYPFLLIYPLLNLCLGERHYTYLRWVVFGHLAFTVFMEIIYYSFIHT